MFPPFLGSRITYTSRYKSVAPLFSCVSSDGNLCLSPDGCKEYILDQINYAITNHVNSYLYNQLLFKPCLDELRLFVVSDRELVVGALSLINQFEDKLGIPHTVVNTADKNYVFRSSPRWLIAPPMVSLYSTILRLGKRSKDLDKLLNFCWSDAVTYERDEQAIRTSKFTLKTLLAHGDKAVFGENLQANWPDKNLDVHWWGICNFSTGFLRKTYQQHESIFERWSNHLS